MTRTAIVCPIVAGIELADYLGWVFHRECDGIRPLFCPADQALRLQRCAVRSPPVARDFCDSNMFHFNEDCFPCPNDIS